MATLLLSAAGSALGSAFQLGPYATAALTAAGGAAGSVIDQRLFGETGRSVRGPRLDELQVQASTEGAPIPRVYGSVRLAGQVIWATRFKETKRKKNAGGGKGLSTGGASVTEYSYSVSFAVGLAEGPVTRIGRVWADGQPLTLSETVWRFYPGSETQAPDPLIETHEGAGNAPAFRGLAYVVFEDLDLGAFGNRVPQLTFEVFRELDGVGAAVKAVTMIPGAGEFAYDTTIQREIVTSTETRPANMHNAFDKADMLVALDQMEESLPNCGSVSLVVAWFGSDLRAGECRIEPKVEVHSAKITRPDAWAVGDLKRGDAELVSQIDGRPAYGGTPSDLSVIRAIQEMQARGLKVTFYPFVLMDVPSGNTLTDPYTGASGQPAYPWRGRITCDPAPGTAGTVDKTAAAASQVASLFGSAARTDFSTASGKVSYSGPAEWSLRRMILHYAHLCKLAGGVDAFLVGSELKALTSVRGPSNSFPAVAALKTLAADVRAILGAGTKISYAADWSEYASYRPDDGSGDVFFHLDPFWADANVDFVGIDYYMPLADWRDGTSHLDALAGVPNVYDLDYLKANVIGGEGFDWYYASDADRASQTRTAIADTAYGKDWVFRVKDLRRWWFYPHYDRPGGVEAASPTAWTQQMKPIWFTEVGCPAVDRGANQPNVFIDPKSVESAAPYHSAGTRDDYMQRRYLQALLEHFDPSAPGFVESNNPKKPVFGWRMVDIANIYVWTWDARPYPAFPDALSVWSDGENWARGHWITGRVGASPLPEIVGDVLTKAGFADHDTGAIAGTVEGYLLDRVLSPREALEPLMLAHFFGATESGGRLRFSHHADAVPQDLTLFDLALDERDDGPGYTLERTPDAGLPSEAKLTYIDSGLGYRQAVAEARYGSASDAVATARLPIVGRYPDMKRVAELWLRSQWAGRERARFRLPPGRAEVEPGDRLLLDLGERTVDLRVERIADGPYREVEAVVDEPALYAPVSVPDRAPQVEIATSFGTPQMAFLDLPLLSDEAVPHAPYAAAASVPWPGGVALYKGTSADALALDRVLSGPAVTGVLTATLGAGPLYRWDEANALDVTLGNGSLESVDRLEVLNGANLCAVETASGAWEVLQFADAELTGPLSYRLTGLLRAQGGTEAAMGEEHGVGARFVLIDESVEQIGLGVAERGLPRLWRYGPQAYSTSHESYESQTLSFQGVGLRPLSPVHLRAEREADGGLRLNWVRRTRTGGDSWEATEVPLGEASEVYAVDIHDGAAVKRTLYAGSPTLLYTAAQQTADFGAPLSGAFSFAVAQLSEAFGRGTATKVTLNV